eukprot:6172292-Pleurochrysis_carterae.AAC.1
MPRPEDPCTVNTLSEDPGFFLLPTRLDWLALIGLGSGDPRKLARRPERASSFTSGGQASRGDDTSGAPAMFRREDPRAQSTYSLSGPGFLLQLGSID